MKKLLLKLLILISSASFSQEMEIDWDVCFGGESEGTYARCIESIPNFGIITVIPIINDHPSYTNYHGGGDSWVLILDSVGNIIHDRCFGGGQVIFFKI
jgi:hypothetical protein